jgi:phosphoketolase
MQSGVSVARRERGVFTGDRDRWAAGYGAIRHMETTRVRLQEMILGLGAGGMRGDGQPVWDVLAAADRVANAGMWLVVHETYARNVYLDGRALGAGDFKPKPEGHTGGALNMVPAYVGYMLANALSGITRSWVMGQGHCVAAIDSVNLLLGNMTPAHAARYSVSDAGLTRYVRDFYSCRLGADGRQDSPLGSHVNVHTAGGLAEGGYLGCVELQWVHAPLPGERLVAFLSDGAFEEQRGSDWAPRWWRSEDSGLVAPIMIANGRRIDQRTTMAQQGGVAWLVRHLRLNHFDPFVFDGKDPAAFAWAILEIERRLEAAAAAVNAGRGRYPVPLPYGIAVAPKGAGFYGAGTNLAHNLPLGDNPHQDVTAARRFNASARRLWVGESELRDATATLQHHEHAPRPRERDHPLATRRVRASNVPELSFRPVPADRADATKRSVSCPMAGVDDGFLAWVQANADLRPRVGNPDEMRSNRMQRTLDALKFRVANPEPGIPEAVNGAVVTALNEEAVASAALGNKGGINIVVTYEAFGAKMHGVVRQEIIVADEQRAAGHSPGWLSVPLVLTSHTWENAKNERSHQDPAMAEAMLGEPTDVSRVLFPADHNSAAAVMEQVYRTHGQIWTLVVPKGAGIADLFTADEARALFRDGGARLEWASHRPDAARVVITAVGAYQLAEALAAGARLRARDVPHILVYLLEPGRFRLPRNAREARHAVPDTVCAALYPASAPIRVFLTHTRPAAIVGSLAPTARGSDPIGLGYANHGGTLDVAGLLFVNGASWAHALAALAPALGVTRDSLLTADEIGALEHRHSPEGIIVPSQD